MLFFNSCQKSGCTQYGSENYDSDAIIDDGSCIETWDKFLGTFQVSSDCKSQFFSRQITKTSTKYVVKISNLLDTLGSFQARIFINDLTIELQEIEHLVTVEGAGVYQEDGTISISYRIRDNRSSSEIIQDCFEICTKF